MAQPDHAAASNPSPMQLVGAALFGSRTPLLLALLFGGLLFFLFVTQRFEHRPKVQTWRVSGIPSDVKDDELRNSLEALPYHPTKANNDLSPKSSNIRQFSFTERWPNSPVATVTFWQTPVKLKRVSSEFRVRLSITARETEVVFDTHFYGLTTLYYPPDPAVDIVAVTGLAGHAIGSWKSPGESDVWIRDYLPDDKVNARVLTYGYDTTLVRSRSKSSIHDLAMGLLEALKSSRTEEKEKRRPIIFIAHSLGGLLVKEALVIAGRPVNQTSHIGSNENAELCNSCYSLIFFGVPNLGIRQEQLVTLLKGQPNYALIMSLVMDNDTEPSDYLKSLNRSFLESFLFDDSPVISYYERLSTRTVKVNFLGMLSRTGHEMLLVTEASATNISRNKNLCDQHPIHADHSSMVKFKHKKDQNYIDLSRHLDRLIKQAPGVIKKRFPRDGEIEILCKTICEPIKALRVEMLKSNTGDDTFDEWLSEKAELHEWLSPNGTQSQFLWLVKRPQLVETTSSEIVRQIVKAPHLGKTQTIRVLCSDFASTPDANQVFLNPVDYILRYILADIISSRITRLQNLPTAQHDKFLNLLDITQVLIREDARKTLGSLISSEPDTNVRIVIESLEQIHPEEDRNMFVEILRLLWDSNIKNMRVFVTSLPYAPIREAFKGLPFLDPMTEYNECLQSLSVDAHNYRQETIDPAEQYTGDWMLKHPKYIEWDRSLHSSIIWLVGKAGSGKSTLLLATLKQLLQKYQLQDLADMLGRVSPFSAGLGARVFAETDHSDESRPIVASFFYRFQTFPGEKTEASHTKMLRSLLFQILKQDVRLFKLFQQTYRTNRNKPAEKKRKARDDAEEEEDSWSFEHLLPIFEKLISMKSFPRQLYLVIDAMDESENDPARTKFLSLINDVCHAGIERIVVKVIIASRPNGNIVGNVEERHKIILQDENATDIDKIIAAGLIQIRQQVGRLNRMERANFDIENFRDILTKNAEGVIIWVSLVLKQVQSLLLRGLTPNAMMQELDKPQPNIEDLYAIIIQRLTAASEADVELGKHWLKLVSFTERALNTREFQDADLVLNLKGKMETNETELNKNRRPISNLEVIEQYMMSHCGGFIEVKAWTRISTAVGTIVLDSDLKTTTETGGLHLLHRTVKDFLSKDKSAPYQSNAVEGNQLITTIGIEYLQLSLSLLGVSSEMQPKAVQEWNANDYKRLVEKLNNWPLLEYILKFLPMHLGRLGSELDAALESLSKTVTEIQTSSSSVGAWMLLAWFNSTMETLDQIKISGKAKAVESNRQKLLQFWNKHASNTSAVDQQEKGQLATQFVTTALVAAAKDSRKWAVKTLLVIGAAPLEDLNRSSALEAAVEGGSSEMVMQLIQHDVEVNHLYTVYNIGHSKRSRKPPNTSISKSTDPKAEESLKNLALFIAARQGNASIVSLLLCQGAEPDIYDESGASAVSVASSGGATEVVGMLLDAGADCESKDSNGRTPLMIAAANGHRGAVKRLLEADAQWNLEDNSGMSALSHAAAGGHEDIILELIKAGANPGLPMTGPASFFTVPFMRNRNLCGREDIIWELQKSISNPGEHVRVALVGLGGVGKTQIALEYAYLTRQNQPDTSVFWVNGNSYTRFQQDYMQIATAANIPGIDDPKADILRLTYEWLQSNESGRWIMVLDCADDLDIYLGTPTRSPEVHVALSAYLPRNPNGSILVTTRNQEVAKNLVSFADNIIAISPMRQIEALEMLQKTMGQDMDQPVAMRLLELLGYLPLAISLAANFMKSRQLSVDNFYNLYQKKSNQGRILSSQFSDMGRDYDAPTSILGTFQISLNELESRHPDSIHLLHRMSFFDIDRIPFSLLKEQDDDSLQLYDTLAPLTSFSLINTDEDSGVSIHRLVHAVIRETMDEETTMRSANEALRLLSAKFPSGDFAEWDVCALLYPHARALFQFRQIEDTNPEQLSLLFHNTGRYLLGRGEYWQAQENSERGYYLRKKYFGPEHSLTLSSLRTLASAFQSLGEYSKAEQLYEQALETMERQLGPDDPRTLSATDDFANVYRTQGHFTTAIELYSRVLKSKVESGSQDLDTLTTYQNLATAYESNGQYEEAERSYMQALTGREKLLGKDHPDTLTTIWSLGNLHAAQGRYDSAVELDQRALEGIQRVLGFDHPDALVVQGNLANVYSSQGRYREAAELLESTLSRNEALLGFDHPDTLVAMNNLAAVYLNQGLDEKSGELYQKCLERAERVLGPLHPTTLSVVDNLASVYQNQKRYRRAEELYSRSLEGRERILGSTHPETLSTIDNLASVYQNQERYREAEDFYARSLKGRKSVLGNRHPTTLATMERFADFYEAQGKYSLAKRFYLEVLESKTTMLGPDDPGTRVVAVKIENLKEDKARNDRLRTHGNIYGNVTVSGSARAHIGNTYGNIFIRKCE
ncbi:hypothetical protein BP6252_10749 [Coleophoma cylindrospora]|uniref:AAA+ ATPase domain-containing protein n=1 Tax=Coleophoma cylindrospora TaxID=1849047 RepID=A0A3D8QTU2_9HELO|nr:hypothetical protein BP6252_10749 [Coleophoma cylindrospora]